MLGTSVPGLGGVGLAAIILVPATTILAAASVTTTIGTATASESAAASAPTSATIDGCHVRRGVWDSWLSFIQ